MTVSAISFDAWAIGGAWGTVDDADSLRALHAAVDAGMNGAACPGRRGVSVETVDEALRAVRHPNVQSVQIIFNMFRLKPSEAFFPEAKARRVGILARVPLASGLLTGKLRRDSKFEADDHRQFNREGERFDKGETFSGVPYDVGLEAVERLRPLVPAGATLAVYDERIRELVHAHW